MNRRIVEIKTNAELDAALAGGVESVTWKLWPGEYNAGRVIEDAQNFTMEAVDPADMPRLVGAPGNSNGLTFRRGWGITLRRLLVCDVAKTGISFGPGDGSDIPWKKENRPRDVVLEGLEIRNVGYNGIKLVWVDGVCVALCVIKGWPRSGVDVIGCEHGTISNCVFGPNPVLQYRAVLLKGGCRDWRLVDNVVVPGTIGGDLPLRAAFVIGGKTAPEFFWPPLRFGEDGKPVFTHEAGRVEIIGNQIDSDGPGVLCMSADGVRVDKRQITYERPVMLWTPPDRPPCQDIHIGDIGW